MGGSHGGFIGAWLSTGFTSQDMDRNENTDNDNNTKKPSSCGNIYRAVVLRNPVVDLNLNQCGSDIPDWSYFEANLPLSLNDPMKFPKIDDLRTMVQLSPSRFVPFVDTPTLILAGGEDCRVPMNNSVRWYHLLKQQGTPTKYSHNARSDTQSNIKLDFM